MVNIESVSSKKSYKTLRLILGDQLNHRHSWFNEVSPDTLYCMMEIRQETDYVRHHIQKICGFFGVMRNFASYLEKKGHEVRYLRMDDPENRQSLGENLTRMIQDYKIAKFEYMLPDEYRLDKQLNKFCRELAIASEFCETEHFYTERDELGRFFSGKKTIVMESFYRMMREKHDVLMEKSKPVGGDWNYDAENRNRYDGKIGLIEPKVFRNDISDIYNMVVKSGVDFFGEIEPDKFPWPLDRRQALALLRYFIDQLLPHFGTYQDAMTEESRTLFHSRLSFALNTKMLSPHEVIERVCKALEDSPKRIGIAQAEGFVRQILGWREFMRGVYWAEMPEYAEKNYFNHSKKLPSYYWTGKTDMNCMHHAISQSLETAYAHHIQRLMITGNFALLAGIDPDEVDKWYLGIYIDAVEWVEITNTRGMSQFADGGLVATKPYISSSNYINKMSDYCRNCRYDRKKRYGEKACPFNSLYWYFLERHREKLEKNHRLRMIYRTLDRIDKGERKKLFKYARYLCDNPEKI